MNNLITLLSNSLPPGFESVEFMEPHFFSIQYKNFMAIQLIHGSNSAFITITEEEFQSELAQEIISNQVQKAFNSFKDSQKQKLLESLLNR